MKLRRLRLENFRQHVDSLIRFEDGMTAIVGPNGSGKSTVLEAITFALYGQQRSNKDTIRFYWSENRKRARVELEFELDGKRYLLERSEAEASLCHLDGPTRHELSRGLREVTLASEKLLSLSYEQFKNSFCAEQKALAFLDFKSMGARQDEIARMLGFDRLKGAALIAKERAKSLRDRVSGLQMGTGNEEELIRQVAEAKTRVEVATDEAAKASVQKDSLEKRFKPAQDLSERATRYLDVYAREFGLSEQAKTLKQAVANAESEATAAKKDAEALALLIPKEKEYQEAEVKLAELAVAREAHQGRLELRTQIEHLNKELVRAKASLAGLRAVDTSGTGLVEAEKALADRKRELEEAERAWRADLQDRQSTLDRCEERLRAATQLVAEAEKAIALGVCPECGQSTVEVGTKRLTERQVEAAERGKERDAAKAAHALLVGRPKELAKMEAALEEAQKSLVERQNASAEAARASQERAREQARVNELERDLAKLNAQLPVDVAPFNADEFTRTQALVNARKADHETFLRLSGSDKRLALSESRAEEARKIMAEAKALYTELKAERQALGFASEDAAREAIKAFQELHTERQVAEKVLQGASQLTQAYQQNLTAAEAKLAEYRGRADEIKRSKAEGAMYDTTAKELLQLRERLNRSIRPDLEARASDNLNLLTNGRYPVLTLDENFNPTVIEDEIAKPVISGGEEDVVALALRLALSELIQERQGRPMSLLILDEVFGSLDADRRQAVLERLAAIKTRFEQILVISHIEEINQVADQCLYVNWDSRSRACEVTDAPREFASTLF